MRTTLSKTMLLCGIEIDIEMPIEYDITSTEGDVHEHFGFKYSGSREYTFSWTFTDEPKVMDFDDTMPITQIAQALGEFERLRDKSIYNIFSREEIIEQLNGII